MDSAQTSAVAGPTVDRIVGVRIPNSPSSQLWDIAIKDGKIATVDAHDSTAAKDAGPGILDGCNRLIAPSLCHAHIHLDKCFLLQDPKYQHLQIESGDFNEAMELTNKAKSTFEEEDLLRRGRLLIEESIKFGVTAMRAFVEVDGVVKLACLHAGIKLKEEFKERCHVQICAFAQLPLFSGEHMNHENMNMMLAAVKYEEVEVLGTTPYVEQDIMFQKLNVHWMTGLALENNKHLDLHLDYHLEENKEPFIWEALKNIEEMQWAKSLGGKRITFGHCTRLTRFQEEDWTRLKQEIGHLPLSFVGLPTSDLFMMRTPENRRGTLPIVSLIEKYGFDAAMAVNNVGNAFTPHGSCDPLVSITQNRAPQDVANSRVPSNLHHWVLAYIKREQRETLKPSMQVFPHFLLLSVCSSK